MRICDAGCVCKPGLWRGASDDHSHASRNARSGINGHPERLKHLFAQAANITTGGVNPGVGTDPVFGNYITWMSQVYPTISPTPDQFDAFVTQISKMWATQPNWTDAQVAAIRVPTAVVAGEYDEAILRPHTEKIAALIPGAKLVILPDVSHFAMLQAPDDYIAAVRAFIDN